MALQVWLPLNGNSNNNGISGIKMTSGSSVTYDNNGKIGKCLICNGSIDNSIYDNQHNTSLNFTDNFSWSLWINTNYTGSTSQYAFTVGRADGEDWGYGLRCASTTSCNIRFGSSGWNISVTGGEWTHIAFTKSGNIITIYKNGNIYSTNTFSGTLPTYTKSNGLGIGCFYYISGRIYPFYGKLNDFRIYNHCLNPQEVKEIAKGLVLHYTLDDPYSENIVNLVPSGNYSTVNNSVWGCMQTTSTIEDAIGPVPFVKNNKVVMVKLDTGSGGGCGLTRASNITISPNTTYTYSMYVKPDDDFVYTHANFLYRREYNSSNTQVIETGINIVANRQYIGDGWYRIWNTFTSKADTVKVTLQFFTYPNKTITYYIGGTQLEIGNTLHVYIDGTNTPTTIYDSSGYQNNGTITGTLTINNDTPRYNYSSLFSSTVINYIRVPYQGLQGSYNNKTWTIAFWINTKQQGNRHMITGMVSNYNTNIELSTSNTIRIYSAGTPDWSPGITCTLNTWIHVVVVITSTYIKAYKNGVLVGTNNTAPNWAGCTTDFLIGSDQRIGSYFLGAILSDFRIYATVLSDQDILELYNTSAYILDNGVSYVYKYKGFNSNMIMKEDYGIVTKQWLGGLYRYEQSNCKCTLTDTGYRIYRTPNINSQANGGSNTMWGGFVLKNTNNQFGLIKGHTYILRFDVKGQSTNAGTDLGWYNMVGWSPSNSGLLPTPSNVEIVNPVTANFNSTEWQSFTYKWTINDDIYKVCTNAYTNAYVVGNSYVSYLDFKFGFTYANTGSLGTDIYIRNICMYDITSKTPIDINKQGIFKTDIFFEDKVNSFKDAKLDTEQVKLGENYATSKEFKEI